MEVLHIVAAVGVFINMPSKLLVYKYFPVLPKVSIAYNSPSSIFVLFTHLTIGTLFPA
jgi:hypothetical protein